jgi:hypothetical protein
MTPSLHDERAKLNVRFSELSAKLAFIKHQMMGRGRVPQAEYERLSAERALIVAAQVQLQAQLAIVKSKLISQADAENEAKREDRDMKSFAMRTTEAMAGAIIRLRDQYRSQARDPRCTEAVRFMANEFQDKLSKIVSGDV